MKDRFRGRVENCPLHCNLSRRSCVKRQYQTGRHWKGVGSRMCTVPEFPYCQVCEVGKQYRVEFPELKPPERKRYLNGKMVFNWDKIAQEHGFEITKDFFLDVVEDVDNGDGTWTAWGERLGMARTTLSRRVELYRAV